MKISKENTPHLLLLLFELIIGILLLINPTSFTRVILICFGAILLALGILYLIHCLKNSASGIVSPALILPIITIIIGLFFIIGNGIFLGLVSLLSIVFGVILVVIAIYKIINCYEIKKAGGMDSAWHIVSAILALAAGIFIAFNPFGTLTTTLRIAGIIIIVEVVIDLLPYFGIASKNN